MAYGCVALGLLRAVGLCLAAFVGGVRLWLLWSCNVAHWHEAARLTYVVLCGVPVLHGGAEPCAFNFLLWLFEYGVHVRCHFARLHVPI